MKCTNVIVKILKHVQIIGITRDTLDQKSYFLYIFPSSEELNNKKSITFNLTLLNLINCCFLLHPTTSIRAFICRCYPLMSEAEEKLKSESQEIDRLLVWRNEP